MCGFAGFVGPMQGREPGKDVLGRMAATLVLRGPDEQGVWLSADGVVGLAHRRLAVVGLGRDGRQPMVSTSGRWMIAYNGEIYNFRQLRAELEHAGALFRGHSDTEVLLVAVEVWGLEAALTRSVGMFAFALWDNCERRLILARDRFGEKPLYYGWQGGSFLFSSDLAAMRVHPAWEGGVDRVALGLYIRRNYMPSPWSIHPGIRKLRPGTWLSLGWNENTGRWTEEEGTYWSATMEATRARASGFNGNEQEAEDALLSLLQDVIAGQSIAEVPLGAFLSGGIDSTTVVALMQAGASRPIRTFTVGFAESAYDESQAARRVADYLGTVHTEFILNANDARAIIPALPTLYSEPFADASQIPMALVSRAARQQVTVALSGDGGDEVFGGYNRYVAGERLWRRRCRLPQWAVAVARSAIMALSPSRWDRLAGLLVPGVRQPGEKFHKVALALSTTSPKAFYDSLASFWHDRSPVLPGAAVGHDASSAQAWGSGLGMTEAMMLADTLDYLPDDILVKVDRAAMGFSLETRAPFLDHRVFELMWALPLSCRVRDGGGKHLLRRILARYVPERLVDRPKAGFALPIDDWLRGPLRDWSESLLGESRLRSEGYFDAALVRQAWSEHLSRRRNRQYDLWGILMFQAWLDHSVANAPPAQARHPNSIGFVA